MAVTAHLAWRVLSRLFNSFHAVRQLLVAHTVDMLFLGCAIVSIALPVRGNGGNVDLTRLCDPVFVFH